MRCSNPDGVWPTMVTPYTDKNKIDYNGLEQLLEWYIDKKVDGLFAVCQSSEMFFLTQKERIEISSFVVDKVNGRVPVIASGHVSDSMEDQIYEIKAMVDTGVDAVILVSNRLALENESDDIWKHNMECILKNTSGIQLGIYECPYPYKRIMSLELLKWCASTDRFLFMKDTCCDSDQIREKIDILKGGSMKLYNANSATLLETLQYGASGYCGVMANFHPELYVWLMKNWSTDFEKAKELQKFLGMTSCIENRLYPANAKYYLSIDGVSIYAYSRSSKHDMINYSDRLQIQQLYELSKEYIDKLYRIHK